MVLENRVIWAPAMLAVLLAASAPAKAQSLRVGAARIDITPAADPANPPSGKYAHEKLYLRAIVLDNGAARAALIGADQSMLFENIWAAASKQVAAELNCPVENIVLSMTHTHSEWGPGDQPFRRFGQAGGPGGRRPRPTPTHHRRPSSARYWTPQSRPGRGSSPRASASAPASPIST
jgi:hypothetical protein